MNDSRRTLLNFVAGSVASMVRLFEVVTVAGHFSRFRLLFEPVLLLESANLSRT